MRRYSLVKKRRGPEHSIPRRRRCKEASAYSAFGSPIRSPPAAWTARRISALQPALGHGLAVTFGDGPHDFRGEWLLGEDRGSGADLDGEAGVDGKGHPGDITGFIRGEPQHRVADVDGLHPW